MSTLKLSTDDELMTRLKEIALRDGVTVETLVEQLLKDFVTHQTSRIHDPIVGIFDSGEVDLVARHEDILRDEWQPD